MRNKVFWVFFAVMLIGVLFFAGCKKQGKAKSGATVLSWAMWDADMTVYHKPLVEAYKEKRPGIKLELIDLGSADYQTILLTQLSGGADLDILTIKDIPGYANMVRQNRMEPLSSYISSANIDTSLYGGVVEQLAVNDEVYALPFRTDFWVIFYNKDIFDAAGVPYPENDITLDQYDALARRLTSGSGSGKIYGAHYHTWRSAVQLFGILDGKNTIVGGSYDFLTPHYDRVLKEQDDGIVMSYAMLRTSGTHYSGVFFNSQAAMLNMGTWFIATQIDKIRSGEARSTNWGLAKYPHPEGVPAGTTLGTITSIAVNRNSANKDAALDFMNFLTGPEGAAILAKTGTIPAIMNEEVIDALASIPGFPSDPNSKEALNVYKTYLEMPLHERSAEIEQVLNEAHDSIMTRNMSVADGIIQMNERVGSILSR